ncbi:OmpP1/FadL family transporter [Metapseudomonas resinovorans]|uniref:Putative long-chain fatty acid transport protein n=1 Tax=Metapseudomonas resinovorans NBRC 106553 TaxID=1245471 RepID=S6APH6_METRE|nr:TonB-dependent receptor [Pseudomonas resinovorans]BAN47568.1 putative long-chain fatty acid transport protein [Pseudomonas resinovorans NBRC 106553]
MISRVFKTALALAVSAASSYSLASGFALNEQSISGMGTAFAGRSSSADDATTVFGNPAGMARLKREQVSVGAAVIFAKTDIDDARSTFGGTNDGDMVPTVGVPMGYYVKPIDDKWAVGFGMYVPFGLMTDYEGSFAGRYFGNKSEVQVITLQPTVSYRINDQLSVGFGPTINRIEGELTSAVLNPLSPGSNDGKVKVKGDDTALGFNAGVLFELDARTRFGLTYHSKVDYTLRGDTTVSGSGFVLGSSAGKYDASLDLETPESVDFSVTHDLNDAWTLYAGSTWTRWSRLEEIRVENKGVGGLLGPALGTIVEEQDWHDTWSYAVGAAYKLNPQWTLRAGLAYDQTPTRNEFRSPRIPSDDRKIFSLGAAWSPNDDMTIDVAYSYLKEEDAKIDQVSASKGAYQATFQNSAHGLGAQLTYRF